MPLFEILKARPLETAVMEYIRCHRNCIWHGEERFIFLEDAGCPKFAVKFKQILLKGIVSFGFKALIFRRVRKIAKSDYYIHVCPSSHME
jgi:hypothetical protein